MEILTHLVILAVVSAIVELLWRRVPTSSRRSLPDWVDDNGYTMFTASKALFRKGSYRWLVKSTVIFCITVFDEMSSMIRLGTIRFLFRRRSCSDEI